MVVCVVVDSSVVSDCVLVSIFSVASDVVVVAVAVDPPLTTDSSFVCDDTSDIGNVPTH